MSLEFFSPENRTATDVCRPITAHEDLDWEACTQKLAEDCLATTELMAQHIDEPLPAGYIIDVVAHEIEEPQIIILKSPADLADVDKLLKEQPPVSSAIWLRLMPHDNTDKEKPVIIFDNDAEFIRLYIWGPCKTITIRGSTCTVRQKQSWVLWDYHKTKKDQGHTEADFPGSQWQPQYSESVIMTDEDGQGEDLVTLLFEFDESIEQAQQPQPEKFLPSPEDLAVKRRRLQKIRTEVSKATDFSTHQTFGQNVLREAHDALATIRAFIQEGVK